MFLLLTFRVPNGQPLFDSTVVVGEDFKGVLLKFRFFIEEDEEMTMVIRVNRLNNDKFHFMFLYYYVCYYGVYLQKKTQFENIINNQFAAHNLRKNVRIAIIL